MSGLPAPPPPDRMLPAATFDGQVVIVTGGGTGLGKAIAIEFARLGAGIGIVSRSAEHRAAGVAAVESVSGGDGAAEPRVVGVELDVREPESVVAAFDTVEAALGPVTVLVNNAAANFPVAAADLSPNGWRALERIVLDGTFFCSQELIAGRPPGKRPRRSSTSWPPRRRPADLAWRTPPPRKPAS